MVSMSATADCKASLEAMFKQKGADWESFLARVREDEKIAAATGHSQIVNRLEMFADNESCQKEGLMESFLLPGNNGYLSLDSVANFIRFRTIDWCEDIKCPVYMMHGEKDELIAPENSEKCLKK